MVTGGDASRILEAEPRGYFLQIGCQLWDSLSPFPWDMRRSPEDSQESQDYLLAQHYLARGVAESKGIVLFLSSPLGSGK